MTAYHAYVKNDSGAGEKAGDDSNLNRLKQDVRRRYGKGWTVIIEKVESDELDGYFPPEEVARFRLRK